MNLSLEQRKALLLALQEATKSEEVKFVEERKQFFWLPTEHKKALDPRVLVVRGERGAGKTALFHFLSQFCDHNMDPTKESAMSRLRERWDAPFSWEKSRWLVGYSEEGTQHPSPLELSAFYGEAPENLERLRHFWFGSLVGLLGKWILGSDPERKEEYWEMLSPFGEVWRATPNALSVWVPVVGSNVALLLHFLDEVERLLERDDKYLFVMYDQLDRIGLETKDLAMQRALIRILLQIWQSFSSRYKRLRAKIFLREDLYQAVSRSYTDAGKLEYLSCSMRWSQEDLYRMLYRRMLALEPLRVWLREHGLPVEQEDPEWGVFPPPLPETGEASQLSLVGAIVGRIMGSGVNKGYVHRWIPNHLSDANQVIVPRSMLNLFFFAARFAERTPKAQDGRLLHHTELMEGLKEASTYRVKELQEEYRVVQRLEKVRGITLFAEREDIERLLSETSAGWEEDGYGSDGKQIFAELERLGVFKVRGERGVDMPDLYRLGLDIKRRGGVARA